MKNNIEDISREIHVIQSKKNAILFAEFVSNDQVFDDFWSMSKEHQEKIYQKQLAGSMDLMKTLDFLVLN